MNATIGFLVLAGVLVAWLWRSTRSENDVSGLGWGGGRQTTSSQSTPSGTWAGSPFTGGDGGGFSSGDGGGCSAGDGGGSCG